MTREGVDGVTAPAEPPMLRAEGMSKSYGPLQALGGATFDLARGEIHGLCGHNGAGKSTLVKILTGLVQPDGGRITVAGEEHEFRTPVAAQAAGIAIVDQELSLAPDLSVDENVFLGAIGTGLISRPGHRRRAAAELLAKVGLGHLDPRTLVGSLSIGERQLVEVARMLGRDARILIFDEPTATLSDSEIERVFKVTRELARAGHSVIYISHRLGEVLELCDRVTVMRDGHVVATQTTAQIGDRAELIRLMIGTELAAPPAPPPDRSEDGESRQGQVSISDLTVPGRVSEFELSLGAGQIVGLTGQVGSGTTEVLRAVAGLIPEAGGTVVVEGRPLKLGSAAKALRAGIAFASNDRKSEGLFLTQDARSNLVATRLPALSRFGWYLKRAARQAAGRLAEVVTLDKKRLGSPVETLSGGNQQKVLIGRCLDRPDIKLMILDEPTRGVDVGGRAEIHNLLRLAAEQGVAVLFASTEVDEILELSHVVVTMFAGRKVSERPRSEVTTEVLSHEMTMSRERSANQEEHGA